MIRPLLLSLLLVAAGCGAPSLLVTPVMRSDALEETQVQSGAWRQKVVVIPIDGLIANVRPPGLLQDGDNKIALLTQQLDKAADDSSVKAIVLRINSPGGTVTGSDTMYQLLTRWRAKTNKPIVASIQEIGTSGAYYTALASDRIVAGPTSVVGSIGVIFEAFSVEGTLGKLGIKSEPIKSGPNKDIGSPFRDMTEADRKLLQETVDEYFARFKSLAVERRHLTDANTIATVTDGRVFSGDRAKQLGLVDEVGILDDAIDLARQLANAPKASVVLYRKPYGPGGSIYAETSLPAPQAAAQTTLRLPLPDAATPLPGGFWYVWRP
jgi:protease IV